MKKGLALLLAASMSLSAFSSAFAAEMTAQEKFDALKAKGIFEGYTDGTAGLDKEMTRAEFAMVLKRLMKLEEVKPATPTFKDLKTDAWYYGAIEAAVKAGYINGLPDGTFAPSANVTYEQLAKLLVGALNLEVDANATVEGTVSPKMAGYVKAALDAGLITAQSNYKAAVKRDVLVSATYVADATINKPVVTFGAKQVGAKKIEVTFGAAVDTSKAVISVKNGNVAVNVKTTTWAEDKKSVTLEFANNLAAADYTVSVSGVSENALTATVKAEASKVTKIEFASDKLTIVRGSNNNSQATIGYKVLNQFGEEVNNEQIQVTTSDGTLDSNIVTGGTITVNKTAGFTVDNKVLLTALHVGTSTFASVTATVSAPSKIATIESVKLYHAEGKELQVGNSGFSLELSLKDQYGNALTDPTFLRNYFKPDQDVVVTAAGSSITVAPASQITVTGGKVLLPITVAGAGKTTVTIVSLSSGSRASIELDVKDSAKLDTLTLTAPTIARKNSTVEIPFTAVDQFGNAIKHITTTGPNADITLSVSGNGSGATTVTSTRNYVKDTTTLTLAIANDASNTIIITGVTKTGKFVQLQFNTVAASVPTTISSVKNIEALLVGSSHTVAKDDVVVLDQYGEEMALPANYSVKVEKSGDAVSMSNTTVLPATFTAVSKGTSAITVTLVDNNGQPVPNSSYTYNAKVVEKADIVSYEATVTGTVYDNAGDAYDKPLTVVGVLGDGSKVTVPNARANYEVTTNVPTVTHTVYGKIHSQGYNFGNASEAEVPVIVTVKGANGPQVIVVNVKVSNAAPAISTLEVAGGGVTTKEDTNYVSVARADLDDYAELQTAVKDAIKAVDQYGVEVTNDTYPTIIVTNTTKTINGYNNATTTDLVAGDTFNVTAITANGKVANFKVIVK